ncbi:MAG TPA: ThuA domain-containing protein [Tepidisphaeraceae bacterium]|nr:ThuA domain-containing protein [Tepidisphaeraceae bacterium]
MRNVRKWLAGCLMGAMAVSFGAAPRPAVAGDAAKPIKALLVLGGCCHDYAKQKDILKAGLEKRANIEVTIAYEPDKGTKKLNPVYEKDDWAKGYDVIIHDECSADVKDEAIIERILKPHKDGLPGVLLHCGMHSYRSKGYPQKTPWFDFTGLPSTGHGPQEPIAITFTDGASPITKGLEGWTTGKEELYNNVAGGVLPTGKVLAKGKQAVKGKDVEAVIVWTNEYNGKAKVFATTLGHNNVTVEDDRYLNLVTRGLLWSVGKLADDGKPAAGAEKK